LRIFITGETGFIGSHLSKYLQKSGITVVNNHRINNNDKNEKELNKNRIDILNKEKLYHLEYDIDAIIHLASKTSVTRSIINPYETYYTNIVGTLNILDFARERRINKLINISTYVYGKPKYLPIDEDHPINPHSPYNKSKVLAENLCENYAKDFGLDIVTLRPFYIYGPSATVSSFIPSIIRQINSDRKVLLSHRNTKRDFLFIDDFMDLVLQIVNNFPKGYNVYNVGFGKAYSLENVVKSIEKIIKTKVSIQYDKSVRPNDIVEMIADITAVSRQFKWRPKTDIEKGLESIFRDN
jgi:UDP-glucose 4-epimerase